MQIAGQRRGQWRRFICISAALRWWWWHSASAVKLMSQYSLIQTMLTLLASDPGVHPDADTVLSNSNILLFKLNRKMRIIICKLAAVCERDMFQFSVRNSTTARSRVALHAFGRPQNFTGAFLGNCQRYFKWQIGRSSRPILPSSHQKLIPCLFIVGNIAASRWISLLRRAGDGWSFSHLVVDIC